MRLFLIVETTKIIPENYENAVSKLWDETKVRFVAKCTLVFTSPKSVTDLSETTAVLR